jgi:predicted CopG family antitoxin
VGEYTTNIGIKNGLYDDLKERKSPGQSFSGVIEELLMKAEKFESLKEQGVVQENNRED